MVSKVLFVIISLVNIVTVSLAKDRVHLPIPNQALDQNLYEEVIDPELCHEQINLIRNDTLLALFFADAGIRIPKGIFEGNLIDMGNYHQCLGLNQQLSNNELQGKYCMIRVPMNQSFHLPNWPGYESMNFDPNLLSLDNETVKNLERYDAMRKGMLAMSGIVDHDRSSAAIDLSALELRLAVCIPRPCTTEQAINSFLFNVSAIGFEYIDEFCRLPDDKPWVPGDTVAVTVFSIIGLITLLSTSYDVWQTIILKNDPKTISVIGRSFSVYTNCRRLMTFSSTPSTIECLDGIRALAMSWVVVGHTFTTELYWSNPLETLGWISSWQALWITPAQLTVDTFFALSGFLVVYSTFGKLNGKELLKNIHLFWLNRLLRMFPLLAATVLLEATYLNRMTDGPMSDFVTNSVHACRTNWWATLLHIQNYATSHASCIAQSWYLAIDVQLHILSPIILYWVLLGNKKIAWGALLTAMMAILVASTTYNFINDFPSTMLIAQNRGREDYGRNYYVNTLTRASPFFVGMIFGYIVKTIKLEMSKIGAACFWIGTFSLSTFLIYINYPIIQPDWDNQLVDNLFNSFVRPAWALFVCNVIYACVNGYGGPINWFLSLNVWKLHSRLSYAMYLFHFGLMCSINSVAIAPVFFSVNSVLFKFLAHYALAFLVSFFMVLIIDSPCSTLFKLLLGGGAKRPVKTDVKPTEENAKQV